MGTETAAICGGIRPRIRLYDGSAVSGSVPEMQNSRRNAVKMNRKNLKFRAAVPVSAGLNMRRTDRLPSRPFAMLYRVPHSI